MNHNWESEQIESALNKFRDEQGWIKSRKIRDSFSGSHSAQECRDLMRILVDSYGAFSIESFVSHKYRISFDTDNKEKLLAEHLSKCSLPKRSFPNKKLLLDPIWSNLPPIELLNGELKDDFEKLIERPVEARDWNIWLDAVSYWSTILFILSRLETDEKGSWFPPKAQNKQMSKVQEDIEEKLALVAIELFCMYEALKIGWIEIQGEFKDLIHKEHESCFLEIVKNYSRLYLVSRCRYIPNSDGFYADRKRLQRISVNLADLWNGVIEAEDREDLTKDVGSLSMDKSPITPELLEITRVGQGSDYIKLLLQSPNPEVRIKAARWCDMKLSQIDVPKRSLRRKENK